MKNITISDYALRFDWGTMELIAAVTGKDASNPIEGVDDFTDRAVHIMYGGLARIDEKADRSIQHSLTECRKLIKDLMPGEVAKMLTAFFAVMKIDVDETAINGEQKEKKS